MSLGNLSRSETRPVKVRIHTSRGRVALTQVVSKVFICIPED